MGSARLRFLSWVPVRARAAVCAVAAATMLGSWAGAPALEAPNHHEGTDADASAPMVTGQRDLETDDDPLEQLVEDDALVSASTVAGACSERHSVVPVETSAFLRHVVAPRESVAQIAHRYDVAPWRLREWNALTADVMSLQKGTKLRVKPSRVSPARQRVQYTVQAGDTWWRVAVSHGVDSMDLRSYNWPYRGKMTPGETLQIWIDPLIYDWIQATPDGVLTSSEEVRRGGVGIGPPNDGVLVNGVSIPEGDGYRLRFPKSGYGTTHAVEQFLAAMKVFREIDEELPIVAVGSMSRPRGGPLGTHQSHQTGRDLDVRLPRRAGVASWQALKASRVDWTAAWRLVQAFARTDVEVIFLDYRMQRRLARAAEAAGADAEELATLLQYPRGRHARRGLVRHADGHDKHLHVRFRCGPCETECVQVVAASEADP
jgi:murein endopeptidase/LysM repeat protein